MADSKDIKRFLANLHDERNSAALYRAIAGLGHPSCRRHIDGARRMDLRQELAGALDLPRRPP